MATEHLAFKHIYLNMYNKKKLDGVAALITDPTPTMPTH